MATATIINRTYTNTFDAQTTTFLIGNAGDIIDASFQFDVEIKTESDTTNVFTVTNNDTIEIGIGNLNTEGFIVGGVVDVVLNHSSGVKNVNGTISVLTPTKMVLTGLTGDTLENGSYPDSGAGNGNAIIQSTSSIEGLELNYNLITNTDAVGGGNTQSVIDGSVTVFKNKNLDATDTVTVKDLVPFGYQSGMAIQTATIVGLGIVSGVQSFQVDIRFMILPDWDSTANFTNNTLPPSNDNQECLTDYIKAKFQPQAANPNVFVQTDSSQQAILGNTGWFNENYNGGVNSNVTIAQAGSLSGTTFSNSSSIPVPDIQTKDETTFQIIIGNQNHTVNSEYKLGFLYTPDSTSIYYNNNLPFHRNLLYSGAGDVTPLKEGDSGTFTGFTNADGARMDIQIDSISSFTFSGTTIVVFNGKFKPNTAFGSSLDVLTQSGIQNLNYLLWVSAGDETLPTLNSDRVSLIVRYGELQTAVTNVQQFRVQNSFLNHAQPASQVGASSIETCLEDDLLARAIIHLDTSQNEFIEEVTFSIECISNQPIGTNTAPSIFTLESNTFDCTQYPIDSSGTQQINLNTTRGFLMASGVDKNIVSLERSSADDYGTFNGYRALYAFRPDWADWQQNLNVDSFFYDVNKLNNGLNNFWADKDETVLGVTWKLQYSIGLKVNRNGQTILTKNSFDFSVRDYEESTVWDGAIETFDTTGTNSLFIGLNPDGIRENGLVQSDKTWVKADFDLEDVFGDVGDIADYYGWIKMEEYRNGGLYAIHLLSTVLDNITIGNFLLPLTGETACKITKISAAKIRLECYVDNAELSQNVSNFKLSARIGISDINLGKYSSHYSLKYN